MKRDRSIFGLAIALTVLPLVAIPILIASKASPPWFVGTALVFLFGVFVAGMGRRTLVHYGSRWIWTPSALIPFDAIEALEEFFVLEGSSMGGESFAQVYADVRGEREPVLLAESVRDRALNECAAEIAQAIGVEWRRRSPRRREDGRKRWRRRMPPNPSAATRSPPAKPPRGDI